MVREVSLGTLLLVASAQASTAQCGPVYAVGSLDSSRQISPDFELRGGAHYDQLRAEITDVLNFGPIGTVDAVFSLNPTVSEITVANLADTDIFWTGFVDFNQPLSAAEQQALLDFVTDGGALVIVADTGLFSDGPNSAAAPFGLSWDDFSMLEVNPTITDSAHPIIDGPFGTVSTIGHASEGSIEDLGPNAAEIASNANGSSIAHIPPGTFGPCSGPVLFFSDVNEFTSNITPFGVGINLADNRVLLRNLFAYLALFPPGSPASTTFRTAGANPASYTALPPVLGTTFVGAVDLGTTGHSLALLIGYETSLSLVLGGGQVLLVNPADPSGELLAQAVTPGPIALFTAPVPCELRFCGFSLSTQAVHFGGVAPFALSNAQDLVLGTP